MPVTKTITLYHFDELSEEAQEKAIEKLWDLNVDYVWWEYIYDDAESIGIIIDEFDCYYRGIIKGRLLKSLPESVQCVLANHGESCDTYAVAKRYLDEYVAAAKEWRKELSDDDCSEEPISNDELLDEFESEDKADEIANDYRKEMLEEYLAILRKEYDYLTSKDSIVESIQANEYLFTETGELS